MTVLTLASAARRGAQGGNDMRLDRLTNSTREGLMAAQQVALSEGHPELTPEHLLAGLLALPNGVASPILSKASVDVRDLKARLQQAQAKLPKVKGGSE